MKAAIDGQTASAGETKFPTEPTRGDIGDVSAASAGKYNPPDLIPELAGLADYVQRSGERFLEQKRDKFNRMLLGSFDLEPIEDGYTHPAETIIEEALKNYKLIAIDWIESIYRRNMKRPAIAAGILRCIGRLDKERISVWGVVMAISALAQGDIEIREAAVRALEMWGGETSLQALKVYAHLEEVPWLKEYIDQVIRDLSE